MVSVISSSVDSYKSYLPDIQLYCDNKHCEHRQRFAPTGKELTFSILGSTHLHFVYRCSNCSVTLHRYSVLINIPKEFGTGVKNIPIVKMGEWPPFGPIVPSKVRTLLRNDLELFHKGLRAEKQGMGIAAFAYYRRVVENRKDELIDEVLRVCKKLNADPALIRELEDAKSEKRFTSAIDLIKLNTPCLIRSWCMATIL